MDTSSEIKNQAQTIAREAYQNANRMLSKIVGFEFLAEQMINYLSRTNKKFFTQERFLEVLMLLEIGKIYYKKRKLSISEKQIYVSEGNPQEEVDEQNRMGSEAFEKFFTEDYIEKYRNLQPEDQLKKIAETLDRIKNRSQSGMTFNQEYEEVFSRSHKRIGLLSKLPVPKELFDSKQQNKKRSDLMVYIGEILFIVRPVIYCLCLRIFGVESYTPYIISLIIDLLRLVLQRKVKFYQPAQREEFKTRNKEMILNYLLRNPFYSQVFRNKVLVPMLYSMFGQKLQFIKNFIITLIEMRCSICLLL